MNQNNTTFTTARHIHFTGIKGVGMTAAALCAQDLGIEISGSDLQEDFVTKDVLTERKIPISIGFEGSHIPQNTDLLVYTGAHQGLQNPEVLEAQKRNISVISHAQAVGQLMENHYGISVCGVGGKTSTAAMLANILEYAGLNPSFLIGVGKVLNLQVPGRFTNSNYFIAEADEYVVSPGTDKTPRFMYQDPKIIICTNVVHDHPDQYLDINETKAAFTQFFQKLPQDGMLVANHNSNALTEILSQNNFPVITYGKTPDATWWVKDSYNGQGKQLVTFATKGQEFNLTLTVPGLFNAMNALAAYVAARHLGIDHQKVIEGLQLFRGSKRRFEKIGQIDNNQFYDDYAHHPTQIVATLEAAKQWLPLHRIIAVFQPHTYTRTKILLDQFAKSFTHADEVIITDIYASSREQKDDSISGYILAEEIKKHHANVSYVPREELVQFLKKHIGDHDAVFTLGAGDIYQIHQELVPENNRNA